MKPPDEGYGKLSARGGPSNAHRTTPQSHTETARETAPGERDSKSQHQGRETAPGESQRESTRRESGRETALRERVSERQHQKRDREKESGRETAPEEQHRDSTRGESPPETAPEEGHSTRGESGRKRQHRRRAIKSTRREAESKKWGGERHTYSKKKGERCSTRGRETAIKNKRQRETTPGGRDNTGETERRGSRESNSTWGRGQARDNTDRQQGIWGTHRRRERHIRRDSREGMRWGR